jgi:hypothetical protein
MDFDSNVKVQKLVEKLKIKLEAEDLSVSDFSDEILKMEISNALLEYYNDRHFTPTDDKPYEDIYAGIIVQLALSALARYGVEGENYHSEGGVIRTYDNASDYPLALTRKIIPLAKGVDM